MALICTDKTHECYGCLTCMEADDFFCLFCGEVPTSYVYMQDGKIIGCDVCIKKVDVFEVMR
ncbi:MAG: hypothetical protein RR036_00290 [Oscillospiraceae bacterium]